MFRFSLRTLVLVSLWCGALMAVWARRECWMLVKKEEIKTEERPNFVSDARVIAKSPDGTRVARADNKGHPFPGFICPVEIYERASFVITAYQLPPLYRFVLDEHVYEIEFVDDDTLICNHDVGQAMSVNQETRIFLLQRLTFHRRFPEWWWGQFYRPEVWLLFVLSVVLIVTFVRRVRGWRARRV